MAEFLTRHVGVVGLGHIGHAFVNLVDDGHKVSFYDRDPKATVAEGVTQ